MIENVHVIQGETCEIYQLNRREGNLYYDFNRGMFLLIVS